jgi:hypothetical protein
VEAKMRRGRRVCIEAFALVIFFLLLEVNSAGDRLLQTTTRRMYSIARNALDAALDMLIANI